MKVVSSCSQSEKGEPLPGLDQFSDGADDDEAMLVPVLPLTPDLRSNSVSTGKASKYSAQRE